MTDDAERMLLRRIADGERGTWRDRLRADFAPWLDSLFWGLQCADGWASVIRALLEEIAAIVGGPDAVPEIQIEQVKEKLGTLRVYISGVPQAQAAAVHAAITAAEAKSARTCETCGRRGRLRQSRVGYWHSACDRHVID